MNSLELKIPPLFLVLIFALFMYITAQIFPVLLWEKNIATSLWVFFFVFGVITILIGALAFKNAQTTVNPTKPETSSALVKNGVYTVTRNPMYLGMASILLGWACYFSNPILLVYLLMFVLYMNRFQIKPEEKFLTDIFGDEYHQYCNQVRRWL